MAMAEANLGRVVPKCRFLFPRSPAVLANREEAGAEVAGAAYAVERLVVRESRAFLGLVGHSPSHFFEFAGGRGFRAEMNQDVALLNEIGSECSVCSDRGA